MSRSVLGGDPAAAARHAQRASGQVAALASVITARRPFSEIAQQLLAARGSLDSLLVRLVEIELRECMPASDAREEVDDLLRTALGRSATLRWPTQQRHRPTTARSHAQLEGRTSP